MFHNSDVLRDRNIVLDILEILGDESELALGGFQALPMMNELLESFVCYLFSDLAIREYLPEGGLRSVMVG